MNEENELVELFDMYSALCLQALIAKMPIMDREGEFSKQITQDELNTVKQELVKSAHGYALFAVQSRQEYIDLLTKK